MIPNKVLLYPQISALFNSHQRSFFLQEMGVDAETYNWTVCRE